MRIDFYSHLHLFAFFDAVSSVYLFTPLFMIPFPASVKVQDVQVEIDELERSWAAGELEPLRETVLNFVESKRDLLLENDHTPLGIQVQNLIMDYPCLDIKRELKDQVHEINKHLWYAGERGHHLPEAVKSEWVFNHAESWRSWRIKEYLYVAYKSSAEIEDLLYATH